MIRRFINYLYLFLSQYKFFWRIQEKKDKFIFNIKKFLFYSKKSISNKLESKESYKLFTKWSFINTIYVIAATFILQVINPYIYPWIQSLLHGTIKPDNVVFKLNEVTNSEYITFLTAIAALGGVFIALYFSSLSAINATLYSNFSKDLRNLLYRDKISVTYIRSLSLTIFFAFTLIGFYLLGYEKIYIAIPILLILIGFTIFSYNGMGNRMHELLNVDTLSYSIFKNIYKYIDNIIKKDIYSKDRNFQNHYFTLTSEELKLLTSLLETSLTNYKIHNTSLQNIHLNILNLLAYYQSKKRFISNESLWYMQKYEYKDLYKMGNLSEINIYLQSGSIPHGENKSDLFWIEDKIVYYVIRILINKVENNEIEDYQNILTNLLEYIKILVKYGNIKYAINIANELKKAIFSSDSIENSKLILLTDYIYALPAEIILTFFREIKIYSYSEISKIVNGNNLSKDYAKEKFNENLSETLNWLQKKLDLEIKAEGREISPKWYQLEIIMLTYSKQFVEDIEAINSLFDEFFDNDLEAKDIQLYSMVLNRKWECINKYMFNYHLIERILTEYTEKRKIDDLDWKKFSINEFKNKNESIKNRYIVEIGNILNKVEERKNTDKPDIKGFFLQITSDNLIELTIKKSYEDLLTIYPKFFLSCMTKYYDLRPNFNINIDKLDIRKENEFILSFLPIMNLIELTGLINIILEFHEETRTWEQIENYWLTLLNNEEKFLSIDFLEMVISISESQMGLPPGDMQRDSWTSNVRRYFSEHIKKDTFRRTNRGPILSFDSVNIILHDNVLIRKFIGNERHFTDIDGIDIFIYSLLEKNFKDKEFKFGWKRKNKSFEDSLKRDEKQYSEYKNARKKT